MCGCNAIRNKKSYIHIWQKTVFEKYEDSICRFSETSKKLLRTPAGQLEVERGKETEREKKRGRKES